MAIPHGKYCKVLCDEYDLSSYFRQATTRNMVEPGETTTFGVTGSAKTYVTGLNDGGIDVDGLFDGAALAVDAYFGTIFGSSTDRVISVAPNGVTIGNRVWQAGCIAVNYEVDAPVADVVSVSASFQADGGVTSGVSLWDLTSVSATANGTSVDNAAGTTNGGVAHLHITVNTRSNTVDIKGQHSTDNAAWGDLVSFTQVAASTISKERKIVATGTTVNRYLRIVHTLGAGTGAVTYQASFARR